MTTANLIKMLVGVAYITGAKSIAQAGIYGAIISYVYAMASINFCAYLLLKARNRFKSDHKIVDICDLGAKLYGPGIKPFLSVILVATNTAYLMAYCMFLGVNIDQLMCKSFKVTECHKNNLYTAIVLILLFPINCMRTMNNIGYFSTLALAFTFAAIIMILVINCMLIGMEPAEIRENKHIEINDDDRNFNYFEGMMVPVVAATFSSLYKNHCLLNLYAEHKNPSSFYMI